MAKTPNPLPDQTGVTIDVKHHVVGESNPGHPVSKPGNVLGLLALALTLGGVGGAAVGFLRTGDVVADADLFLVLPC